MAGAKDSIYGIHPKCKEINIGMLKEDYLTHAHLLPRFATNAAITTGVVPSKNIGRTFSPLSDVSRVRELDWIPKPKVIISDPKMDATQPIRFEFIDRSTSDHIFSVDWDKKLTKEGYGTDCYSEGSITSSILAMEENQLRSKEDINEEASKLGWDKTSLYTGIADQPSSKPQSAKKSAKMKKNDVNELSSGVIESYDVIKSGQYKPLKSSDITYEELDSRQKEINLAMSSGELVEVMRRATEEVRVSDKILDLILAAKGLNEDSSKSIGWDRVKKARMSSIHLTREFGCLEFRNVMLISEMTMVSCMRKNRDGTQDLLLYGTVLQNRMGRRLSNADVPRVLVFITEYPKIVYLDLSYNNITSEGLHIITSFLTENDTLIGLNLMCNDIKEITSHDVVEITENTTLKSLRLNSNFIGKKGGEYVSFILLFKELEHLDISETDQDISTIPWLVQAAAQSASLKALDVSRILGQQFYGEHTKHVATLFGDLLKFSQTLVELHLQKNSLCDHDMHQLMEGFRKNHCLELLDLSCNRIGDLGASIIATFLHCGAPLKALMLSHNRIRDAGARALAFELPKSQIKLLDLACNRIGDLGMTDLIYTIKKPYPLLALFIFGNLFTEISARIILKQINCGLLMPHSLDINITAIDHKIQHSYNPHADRYRTRYYRVAPYGFLQIYSLKKIREEECIDLNTCLNYMYHNVVNPKHELQKILPQPDLLPYRTVTGSCLL